MIRQVKKWMLDVPDEIWLRFEDLGYFPKDISLQGAINMAKMIRQRMLSLDEDDFYTELYQEYPEEYAKALADCNKFLDKYSRLGRALTQSDLREINSKKYNIGVFKKGYTRNWNDHD